MLAMTQVPGYSGEQSMGDLAMIDESTMRWEVVYINGDMNSWAQLFVTNFSKEMKVKWRVSSSNIYPFLQ